MGPTTPAEEPLPAAFSEGALPTKYVNLIIKLWIPKLSLRFQVFPVHFTGGPILTQSLQSVEHGRTISPSQNNPERGQRPPWMLMLVWLVMGCTVRLELGME